MNGSPFPRGDYRGLETRYFRPRTARSRPRRSSDPRCFSPRGITNAYRLRLIQLNALWWDQCHHTRSIRIGHAVGALELAKTSLDQSRDRMESVGRVARCRPVPRARADEVGERLFVGCFWYPSASPRGRYSDPNRHAECHCPGEVPQVWRQSARAQARGSGQANVRPGRGAAS